MFRRSKFVQYMEKEKGGARSDKRRVNQSGKGDSAEFEFNTAVYEYVKAETIAGKSRTKLLAVFAFTPSRPTNTDALHAKRPKPRKPKKNREGDMCSMSIVTVIKNITRIVARVRIKRTKNQE